MGEPVSSPACADFSGSLAGSRFSSPCLVPRAHPLWLSCLMEAELLSGYGSEHMGVSGGMAAKAS